MCKVGLNDLWRLFLFLGQAGVVLRVLRLSKVQPLLRFSDLYNVFPADKIDIVRLALMPHTYADFARPNLGPQISALFASPSKVAMLLCNIKRPLPCSCNAWQPCQAFMQQTRAWGRGFAVLLT